MSPDPTPDSTPDSTSDSTKEAVPVSSAASAEALFAEAVSIMRRLRSPDGCPWDREQTFDSVKRHTLEETYEVFDAIERRHWPDLKDELGDLLLQVLFYAQMADEAGYFTIAEVVGNLNAKLVRRHPHVFGEATAADSGEVLRNWEAIKREEKREQSARADNSAASAPKGLLEDVPRSMPALMEAAKLGSRAAKVGFDWPSPEGLFDKMEEEQQELRQAMAAQEQRQVEEEVGDLLFTAVNLARHLKVDPEGALRATNAKFRRRFASMEAQAAAASGGDSSLASLSADAMEQLWKQAKDAELRSSADGEQ